jgi:hypothetical protein
MQYWQIAAGSFGRDYAADFLRFGMAFVGGERQRRTMKEVACGDRVILKSGKSIVAVGEVQERNGKCKGDGDKEWLRDFDGWDLSAYCFVEWHKLNSPISDPGLGIATIQRVHRQAIRDRMDKDLSVLPPLSPPDPEPTPTTEIKDGRILEHLIRHGLRVGVAEELTTAFKRIRLLAQYYRDREEEWKEVREHETRTFLIIPLLLALGWAEQQIKIELPVSGGRVDIACFPGPYTKKSKDAVMLIESKGFSQGLDLATGQAEQYAESFPDCQLVVVTNGYCYKAFERGNSGYETKTPSAYLNLLLQRDKYPRNPDVEGCLKALELLLPSSRMQDGRRQAPAQR